MSAQRPSLTNLDLIPVYEKGKTDLGLTSEDIQAASRVLARLLGRPDLTATMPPLIGEIKPELELQLGHALEREEYERKMAETREIANMGRRKFLVRAVKSGLVLTGVVGLGEMVYTNFLSPEVAARQAEETRRKKELFERNSSLGLDPTSFSVYNWRVRYGRPDESVSYTRGVLSIISSSNYIYLQPNNPFDQRSTGVMVSLYTRSDGVSVPELDIRLPNASWESWILRDKPTSEIDNRVVVFENIKTGEVEHLSITQTKASNPPSFEIDRLQINGK